MIVQHSKLQSQTISGSIDIRHKPHGYDWVDFSMYSQGSGVGSLKNEEWKISLIHILYNIAGR